MSDFPSSSRSWSQRENRRDCYLVPNMNIRFQTWSSWLKEKIKLIEYIWRKMHKRHCPVSVGEIKSNILYNFINLFLPLHSPLPTKVSVEMVFWFHTGGRTVAVQSLFSKLFIILQAIGPRTCYKDSTGHMGCACHFFPSSHLTSNY